MIASTTQEVKIEIKNKLLSTLFQSAGIQTMGAQTKPNKFMKASRIGGLRLQRWTPKPLADIVSRVGLLGKTKPETETTGEPDSCQ